MWTWLNPVDRLTLSFLLLLAAVTMLFASSIASWPHLVFTYSLLAVAIASLAVLDGRTSREKTFRLPHAFMPVMSVLLIFSSLGDIIPLIRHQYYDDVLIRIDYLLFAVHPTVWMERFNNALLVGLLQFAYIGYYFMPISLGASLLRKNKNHEFGTAIFAIVLCFYLSYIGYLLFPAVGPRFTLSLLQTTNLHAGPVTLWIQQTLDMLEHNKTDAFPSGHTAVALVTLFHARRCRETVLFRILVPAVSALIVSTVYLRYHYVIDVIAGILLAMLTVFISPRLHWFFSGSYHHQQP